MQANDHAAGANDAGQSVAGGSSFDAGSAGVVAPATRAPGSDAGTDACAVDASADDASAELACTKDPSMIGCRGPRDPGCAVCKMIGTSNEFRSSYDDADWYDEYAMFPPAGCSEADCPACASCSYRDEAESRALGARPECEPCPADTGLDPCFDRASCECFCQTQKRLREACPTLVP